MEQAENQRDAESRKNVFEAIEKKFQENKKLDDARLGQFLSNLLHANNISIDDLYYVEDSELEELVSRYF